MKLRGSDLSYFLSRSQKCHFLERMRQRVSGYLVCVVGGEVVAGEACHLDIIKDSGTILKMGVI